jgi:hypothetical protein
LSFGSNATRPHPHSDYPSFYELEHALVPALQARGAVWPKLHFVDAAEYPRLLPAGSSPRYADAKKIRERRFTKARSRQQPTEDLQVLAVASALLEVARRAPHADVLIWEDDCHACRGLLRALSQPIDAGVFEPSGDDNLELGAQDLAWSGTGAVVKVGNGGSGVLIPAATVHDLVDFFLRWRGLENVDVLMWRWGKEQALLPDFLSVETFSAHRGRRSSLHPSKFTAPTWGRVNCRNMLDYWWGADYYEVRLGEDAAIGSKHGVFCPLLGLKDLAQQWKCGIRPWEIPLLEPAVRADPANAVAENKESAP